MVQPIFKPASLLTEHWPLFQQASRLGPVIDLACGQGRNGLFLAAKGIPVILIDRSSERLDEARHLARQAGLAVDIRQLDLEKAGTDPVDIHTYRGICYLETNENARAIEELEKAIELNSENPQTYYYAGVANIRMGNPQRATELFKTFLKMAPYAPEAEHAKFLIDTLC